VGSLHINIAILQDQQSILASSSTDHDRAQLARRIEATDQQIDRLVYELYGLTEEEIRIVEEAAK
jgi:hypothetical protein